MHLRHYLPRVDKPIPDFVLHSNNAGCTWDGGDCCGAKNYGYCKKCKCLDCTYVTKGDACVKDMKKSCGAPKFKGDGYCDGQHDCVYRASGELGGWVQTTNYFCILPVDSNNVAGCSWDGGDCCGPKANIKYCKGVSIVKFFGN